MKDRKSTVVQTTQFLYDEMHNAITEKKGMFMQLIHSLAMSFLLVSPFPSQINTVSYSEVTVMTEPEAVEVLKNKTLHTICFVLYHVQPGLKHRIIQNYIEKTLPEQSAQVICIEEGHVDMSFYEILSQVFISQPKVSHYLRNLHFLKSFQRTEKERSDSGVIYATTFGHKKRSQEDDPTVFVNWPIVNPKEVILCTNNLLSHQIVKRIAQSPGVLSLKQSNQTPFYTELGMPDRACYHIHVNHNNWKAAFSSLQYLTSVVRDITIAHRSNSDFELQRKPSSLPNLSAFTMPHLEQMTKHHEITVFNLQPIEDLNFKAMISSLNTIGVPFYVLKRKHLFVFTAGPKIEALRISLLATDVRIPFGRQEGCLQLKITPEINTDTWKVVIGQASHVLREPVQVEDEGSWIISENTVDRAVIKFLEDKFNAEEIRTLLVKAPDADALTAVRVVAFTVPKMNLPELPHPFDDHQNKNRILQYLQPPFQAPAQPSVILTKETQKDHWKNAVRCEANTNSRLSCVVPEDDNPQSRTRWYQVYNVSIQAEQCNLICSYIDEAVPWVMVPQELTIDVVKEIINFFLTDEGGLQHHSYIFDYDQLPFERNKFQVHQNPYHNEQGIFHLRLSPQSMYEIRQPRFENGKWISSLSNRLLICTHSYTDLIVFVPPGAKVRELFHPDEARSIQIIRSKTPNRCQSHEQILGNKSDEDIVMSNRETHLGQEMLPAQLPNNPDSARDAGTVSNSRDSKKESSPLRERKIDPAGTENEVPGNHIPGKLESLSGNLPKVTDLDRVFGFEDEGKDDQLRTDDLDKNKDKLPPPPEAHNSNLGKVNSDLIEVHSEDEATKLVARRLQVTANPCDTRDQNDTSTVKTHTRGLHRALGGRFQEKNRRGAQIASLKPQLQNQLDTKEDLNKYPYLTHSVDKAAAIYRVLSSVSCYFVAALRILSKGNWSNNPKYPLEDHIRQDALIAIAKGWTLQGGLRRSTFDKEHLAFAMSTLITIKHEEIESVEPVLQEIADGMPYPYSQRFVSQHCGRCGLCGTKFELNVPYLYSTLPDIVAQSAEEIFVNVTPDIGTLKGAAECCVGKTNFVQNTTPELQIVLFQNLQRPRHQIMPVSSGLDLLTQLPFFCYGVQWKTVALLIFRNQRPGHFYIIEHPDDGPTDSLLIHDNASGCYPLTADSILDTLSTNDQISGVIYRQSEVTPTWPNNKLFEISATKPRIPKKRVKSGRKLPAKGTGKGDQSTNGRGAEAHSKANQNPSRKGDEGSVSENKQSPIQNALTSEANIARLEDQDAILMQPPYALISLFDGCGSTYQILTDKLGYHPVAYIGCEIDKTLRTIVADCYGFNLAEVWQVNRDGCKSIYLNDVDKVMHNNGTILKQFVSLLPDGCKVFLLAGSPCTELTIAGIDKGLLGLTGPNSNLFFVVYLILHALTRLTSPLNIRYLVENAGSMKKRHAKVICECLGIQWECFPKAFQWCASSISPVVRDRFFFQNNFEHDIVALKEPIHSSWGANQGPLLRISAGKIEKVPLMPFLRSREELTDLATKLSWINYHPAGLIWDYGFFGGPEKFAICCKLQQNSTIPNLPWNSFIPVIYVQPWLKFLQALRGADVETRDQAVIGVLPLFHNSSIKVPFRIITDEEAMAIAGLERVFERIRTTKHLLTTHTIRSIVGNSFHPRLISIALGSKKQILNWLEKGNATPLNLPSPEQVQSTYRELYKGIIADLKERKPGKTMITSPFRSLKPCFSFETVSKPHIRPTEVYVIVPRDLQSSERAKHCAALQKARLEAIGSNLLKLIQALGLQNLLTMVAVPQYITLCASQLSKFFGSQQHTLQQRATTIIYQFVNQKHPITILHFFRELVSLGTVDWSNTCILLGFEYQEMLQIVQIGATCYNSLFFVECSQIECRVICLSYAMPTETLNRASRCHSQVTFEAHIECNSSLIATHQEVYAVLIYTPNYSTLSLHPHRGATSEKLCPLWLLGHVLETMPVDRAHTASIEAQCHFAANQIIWIAAVGGVMANSTLGCLISTSQPLIVSETAWADAQSQNFQGGAIVVLHHNPDSDGDQHQITELGTLNEQSSGVTQQIASQTNHQTLANIQHHLKLTTQKQACQYQSLQPFCAVVVRGEMLKRFLSALRQTFHPT